MKTTSALLLATLSTSVLLTARAANYADATGDFTGGGFLDIASVDVNNTATTLTLTINLAGDPSVTANNWATHLIGFDTVAGGAGNINGTGGWGKDIQMSLSGMDFFIGNWLNNGGGNPAGASLYSWSGSAWTTISSTGGSNPYNLTASVNSTSVAFSFDLAALGLAGGSSFNFDVYSSDTGSDNVLDALGASASMTWNSAPYDSGANVKNYTVASVPEPTTAALLALGAVAMLRRRK